MPPKRKRQATTENKDDTDGAVMAKAVKKPRAAPKKKAGPWKMPPPLPVGEVLTDFSKKQWRIGGSVGKGGFGEIYLAAPVGEKSTNSPYVIKVVGVSSIVYNLVRGYIHTYIHIGIYDSYYISTFNLFFVIIPFIGFD